ncbi:MAG: Stp1/IreP family PP2C-type Ser/Thr phosphatase [Halanaerobium sp.]
MRFKAVSNIGKVRSTNEDNYYYDEDLSFFMVADGMGGHAAGDVASRIAAEVSGDYDFDLGNPIESMENLIIKANDKIIEESREKSQHRGMGTTFASVIIKDNQLYFANLGDSRIYLYHQQENMLEKISEDHSLVGEMLRKGKITEEEAFKHPQKNIVTQALGLDIELDIDSGKKKLNKEDIVLLCTDGLSDLIRKIEIKNILAEDGTIDNMADKLLNRALNNGGLDNITFILIDMNEDI